jgi:hypothetical protein
MNNAMSQSLCGLEKFCLLIEPLPSCWYDSSGLTKEQLETDVVLSLRQAGITVLAERYIEFYGLPYLYVNLNVLKVDAALYAFAVRISLKEPALLAKKPLVNTLAVTWEAVGVGTVQEPSKIRECIRFHVDRFAADYLAANPSAQDQQRVDLSIPDNRFTFSAQRGALTH